MKKKGTRRISLEKGIDAFLGWDSEFVGKLVFDGATRMDGKFSGEIFGRGSLVIGESAVVNAEIKADAVIISGRVRGDVEAGSRVELYPPGELYGNIKTPVLVINEGGVFEGNCKMRSKEKEETRTGVIEVLQGKKG